MLFISCFGQHFSMENGNKLKSEMLFVGGQLDAFSMNKRELLSKDTENETQLMIQSFLTFQKQKSTSDCS